MGLLTDPKSRERVMNVVSNHGNKLCCFCYIVGVTWFLALAYPPLNASTYFSENALLPGLVDSQFHHDFGAADYYKRLKEEVKRLENIRNEPEVAQLPVEWLSKEMQAIGLDTHVHNFSWIWPHGILKDEVLHGENLYGILRAPRAAGTEAIVLAVPFRPASADRPTTAGIALLLALARSFRHHTHWAKDLVFVVTGEESAGIAAWLSAYHGVPHATVTPGPMHARSGPIQAAINLELGTDTVTSMNVVVEGVGGQLPNLDLVNLVMRLCRRERVPRTLHGRYDPPSSNAFQGWQHSVGTMLHMMRSQVAGHPLANHAHFLQYNIEAVTIQGSKKGGSRNQASFTDIGRVLEGIVRSLNNLLERFHQSFFFYLLPSTERYISIGVYMPPFALMTLPVLIKALSLWIHFSYAHDEADKAKEDITAEDEINLCDILPPRNEVMLLLPWIIMAGMFGLAAHHGLAFIVSNSHSFGLPTGEGLMWGVLALMLSAAIFPSLLVKKARSHGVTHEVDPYLLKCVTLLVFGVMLAVLSLLNFSLAALMGCVWTPCIISVWPRTSRVMGWLQWLVLLAASPLGLLYMACVLQVLADNISHPLSLIDLNLQVLHDVQGALLRAVLEAGFVAMSIQDLVTVMIMPTWTLVWALQYTHIH